MRLRRGVEYVEGELPEPGSTFEQEVEPDGWRPCGRGRGQFDSLEHDGRECIVDLPASPPAGPILCRLFRAAPARWAAPPPPPPPRAPAGRRRARADTR